jgi:Lrp/AsnC family transcriptional regulator, leucine-responsive regulatory protein
MGLRMDDTDRKILRELAQDSSLSNQDLAARVNLSPSPCLRRVRALEAAGIIRGYVALIEGAALAAGFVAYVEVRLERQSEAFSQRFEAVALSRREVIDCAFVTGDYDYLLKIAVVDLEDFHRFLTQVLTRIEGVANTRTIIPVKRIKEGGRAR